MSDWAMLYQEKNVSDGGSMSDILGEEQKKERQKEQLQKEKEVTWGIGPFGALLVIYLRIKFTEGVINKAWHNVDIFNNITEFRVRIN